MCSDADDEGSEQRTSFVERPGKLGGRRREPPLKRERQQPDGRTLDEKLEEEKDYKGEGQTVQHDVGVMMPRAANVRYPQEIFEVGAETSNDECRPQKPGATKRQHGGGMREGERHSFPLCRRRSRGGAESRKVTNITMVSDAKHRGMFTNFLSWNCEKKNREQRARSGNDSNRSGEEGIHPPVSLLG